MISQRATEKSSLILYAAGCRNIQFDDCSWGMIVDPNAKAIFGV